MDYNFHTHTYRCGHADGEDEEYVLRAIECGVKHMGFSDHAAFEFPNGHKSYPIMLESIDEYVGDIKALAEKYSDKIDLIVGFELEYMPSYFEQMLEFLRKHGAEYLILGQHFIGDAIPNPVGSSTATDSVETLTEYADNVCKAINSGVFTYIAHPDMMRFIGDDKAYCDAVRRICTCSLEKDIPLEINLLGIRTGRFYPNPRFWQIAGEVGCPVTFGFDAHMPKDAYDGDSLNVAKWLVKRYKLNYIGMPKIIRLN